jgi:hypothetical protein
MRIDLFAKHNTLSLSALLFLSFLPILLIPGRQACAQGIDSHHFLWYKGHWSPSKKNVFIIEKDSNIETGASTGSGTAIVDPDGRIHVESGGQDEWNKKIDAGIRQIDQWTQQLSDPANNTDLTTHHLNDLVLPDAKEEQQLWNDYKIDPKQDVLSPDTHPAGKPSQSGSSSPSQGQPQSQAQPQTQPEPRPQPSRSPADAAADVCRSAKADYDVVMAFYTAHKHDKDADLNVPPPPEFEYNCYACDSNVRKSYDTTIAHYVRDFIQPEDNIIEKACGLMRAFQGISGYERNVIPEELASAWSRSGACHYFSEGDLAEAVQMAITHAYHRAAKLVMKYHRDFRAATAIIRVYLVVAREYILITGNDQVTDSYMGELAAIIAKNFDFYLTKLRQNDWRQIANIPYMLSQCRAMALLGGNAGDYNFDEYMKRLVPVMNGFVLSVDMDVKIGRGQGYWLSHVKGKCYVGPDFEQDSNQCYKWVVLDEKRPDFLGFYRTKAIPQFDCDLVANEIGAPGANPVYIGSKKFTGNLEGLKMDFCNPGKDTILLSSFASNPVNDGYFRFPHDITQNLGITGEQFFSDENAKKKLVESGKAQEAANKFQEQNQQNIDELRAMAAKMQSDTGKKTVADYQKMMELVNKVKASATAPVMAQMLWIDFEIPVKNSDPVLVNKIFDAKEINPQMAPAFQYAHYTVHIENDANTKKK